MDDDDVGSVVSSDSSTFGFGSFGVANSVANDPLGGFFDSDFGEFDALPPLASIGSLIETAQGPESKSQKPKKGRPVGSRVGGSATVKCDFTLSGAVHLTYKGHISLPVYEASVLPLFRSYKDVFYSIAWEAGDESDPYLHTHIFIGWPDKNSKYRVYDPRLFDVVVDGAVVHPNIQHSERKASVKAPQKLSWPEYVFNVYHVKAPVPVDELVFADDWTVLENPLQFGAEFVPKKDSNKSAPDVDLASIVRLRKRGYDLVSTMEELNIPLKLASQAKIIWSSVEPDYDSTRFIPSGVDLTRVKANVALMYPLEERDKKVCIIVGPTGIGKSMAARSFFKNPFVCRSPEELKGLSSSNDGICMDDCDFSSMKPEDVIFLLTIPSCDTMQTARYHNVFVRKLPLVITSNIVPFYEMGCESFMFRSVTTPAQVDACRRRCIVEIITSDDKLYE